MSVKRKTKDARGLALLYIIEYLETCLGFRRSQFLGRFGLDKSERTWRRYIEGDSPMNKWTFEQFWNMVEDAVQEYLEHEDIGKSLVPNAAEIWGREKAKQKEECRFFFIDLNAPKRSEDFPKEVKQIFETAEQNKKKLLELIKPIFEALDDRTAYSIPRNFLALTTVTAEDCVFLAHTMTRTEEEKEALRADMLQGATVDAGTMLACLQSEKVRCWVNLKNRDYNRTGTAKKSKGGLAE